MKTTGRSGAGSLPFGWASPRSRARRSIAPVAPEPQKTTTSWSLPFTARWIIWRACSLSAVVWAPVAEASVWVFAYRGRTRSRMKSSTKESERPEAV